MSSAPFPPHSPTGNESPDSPQPTGSQEFLQNSREILNQIFMSKIGKSHVISADEAISPRDAKKSKALLTSFFGAKLLPKPPSSADDFNEALESLNYESDNLEDEGDNIWAKLRDCSMGDRALSADDATEVLLLLESLINTDMQKSHEEVANSIFQSIDKEDLKTIDDDFLRYLTSHYAKLHVEQSEAENKPQEEQQSGAVEDVAITEKLQYGPNVKSSLTNIHTWDFNVFELESATPYPLVILGELILSELNLTWRLELNVSRLRRFLVDIQDAYHAKPYHNYIHATDCTQTMYHFLTQCHVMHALGINDIASLALILGAAIHDVGHPGVTGRYLINVSDPLAIQYNDNSPLENMHLSTAFNIWMKSENNFTERMPKAQYRELRRMMIEIVLFTDNDRHFALMEKLESLFSSGDINNLQPTISHCKRMGTPVDDMKIMRRAATDVFLRNSLQNSDTDSPPLLKHADGTRDSPTPLSNECVGAAHAAPKGGLRRSASTKARPMSLAPNRANSEVAQPKQPNATNPPANANSTATEPRQLLLMQVTLHAADVSNPVKPWHLHMKWYPRLMEEFYYQGDLEREQGLPITFAFDRFNPVPLPKFQLGFLKAIVSPMYKSLAKVPGIAIGHCLHSLENNIKNWEVLLASDETGEKIRTVADVAEATIGWSALAPARVAAASIDSTDA